MLTIASCAHEPVKTIDSVALDADWDFFTMPDGDRRICIPLEDLLEIDEMRIRCGDKSGTGL